MMMMMMMTTTTMTTMNIITKNAITTEVFDRLVKQTCGNTVIRKNSQHTKVYRFITGTDDNMSL